MTVTKHYYERLGETVYSEVLENGLEVRLLHRPDYQETIGALAVRFGSLDTVFIPKNRKRLKTFPTGIAHFLEHKLFEMANGNDAMIRFSQLGGEVNAFTGYQQTVYFFSATEHVTEQLVLLQEFTSRLQISQESVDKEREIISQEITMYQDNPDYSLYSKVLAQLYPETPMAEDIAGSLESIAAIDVKQLQTHFDLFYQNSNQLMVVATPEDPELILETIKNHQAIKRPKKDYPIDKQGLTLNPVMVSSNLELPVVGPKLGFGMRCKEYLTEMSIFRYRIALKLLFAMVIGWTSSTYQEWYQKGRLDDSFSIEIEVTTAFQFVVITLDSQEPLAMSRRLKKLFQHFETLKDLTSEHLELVKKEMLGDLLRSMNSLEATAMQLVSSWIDKEDHLLLPECLESLTLEDVIAVGRHFMGACDYTEVTVFPE